MPDESDNDRLRFWPEVRVRVARGLRRLFSPDGSAEPGVVRRLWHAVRCGCWYHVYDPSTGSLHCMACGFLHHRAERVVPNVNLNEDA